MTQYKIQVGSWTKLPNGIVQEDTRDIRDMMAEKVGCLVEDHTSMKGFPWGYIGISDKSLVIIYDYGEVYGIKNEPSLFIPYEGLQKMLNQKDIPTVTSLLNTKLDCRNADGTVDEELSRAFQEACFEQGILWLDCETNTLRLGKSFLYSGQFGLGYGANINIFELAEEKQINFKYSRKLEWEATVVETIIEEDKMVDICGVEYSAKELSEALTLIKSARKG